ncbi:MULTISPECIES: hypothetical protein [Chryseobacterium]|uniref:hypothetical protein n=1 Tax=Chryseobacterium TaxID=59732 RepID=UPI0012976D45|nr:MULTISPECIES: hypothetical protein [Chryseobacterium]MDR6923166.1 hypothetical protein [Chryseobacterium sp. 2987]
MKISKEGVIPYINGALILFIISYIAFGFITQKQIGKENGLGWDGVYYNAAYQVFSDKGNELYKSKDHNNTYYNLYHDADPFNKRVGVPELATALPFDAATSFKLINLIAFFSGLILLMYKWGKKNITIALIFILSILITPQMPFRLTLFYPFTVDGVQFLFIALMLWFFDKPLYVILASILFMPFKESTIPICCIYLGTRFLIYRKFKYLLYIVPVVLLFWGYLQLGAEIFGFNSESVGLGALEFFFHRFYGEIENTVRLLACFFIVFSSFLFIRRKFSEQTLFFTFLIALLSVSGSDLTRIFCVALPFLFDELINNDKIKNVFLYLIIFIIFLPYKFAFTILEFQDSNEIGEGFFITNFEYLDVKKSIFFLIYFVVCNLLLFFYLKYARRKQLIQ